MISYGLRRYWRLQAPACPHCGQPRQRFWRAHPIPLPKQYGRGLWLQQDCRCVVSDRDRQRNLRETALQAASRPEPLPPRLRSHSFANFKTGPYNEEAFRYCRKFAQRFGQIEDGEGLFLFGSSGVGKTHLACAVVNCLKEQYGTGFVHVPTLWEELRRQARSLDSLLHVELLVLDDLGSERSTDWALEQLLIIVDNRINYRRPTIITANFDSQQLAKLDFIVGMRLASRINGSYLPVLVQGPDWRQQRYRQ